jgi:hypothetical protein
LDENEKSIMLETSKWHYEGIAWYAYPSQNGSTVPIYRFYSTFLQQHLFTADADEALELGDNALWRDEGIAWYAAAGNQTLPTTTDPEQPSSVATDPKQPLLALMVSTDTDSLQLAWVPGGDGITPADSVKYDIHLSAQDQFTPGPDSLKKTVTGETQTDIAGLETDTLYYGVIIATYSDNSESVSNALQSKTYKYTVKLDENTVVSIADDLGLGKYTTADGVTYTFPSGTAPEANSVLFAENSAGGKTLRRVVSATTSGSGEVIVTTGDASLTDVIDRGSIYSSVKLFDVQQAASRLDNTSDKIASGSHRTRGDGSQYSRIEWKDGLLAAEQTDFAYNEQDLTVEPQGNKRTVRSAKLAGDSVFDVNTTFKPDLITWAEWGGEGFIKKLESAQVAAIGTLSLEAIAKLNFSAEAEWENTFEVWKTDWISQYPIPGTPIPVWQRITLTVEAVVSASASAEVKAEASAKISETIEVGAKYDGTTWTPYITYSEDASLSASLTVVGGAEAEIRLIPSIEVGFYEISSAKISVEPFVGTGLAFKETTDNAHFIAANPEHILQLTSFGAEMGLEGKLSVSLGALGILWEVVPETCVLGTGSCLYQFDSLEFFSIPELSLRQTGMSEDEKEVYLELQVEDGTKNPFDPDSVIWEVFPAHLSDINPTDAEIIPKSCTGGEGNTTCEATLIRGLEEEYTVFVSGYGVIGETGRQFKELTIGKAPCSSSPVVEHNGLTWTCDFNVDDGEHGAGYSYRWHEAKEVCDNLDLGGYHDWRLPGKEELIGLQVLKDNGAGGYIAPTIDTTKFLCVQDVYWAADLYTELSSSWCYDHPDPAGQTDCYFWGVNFGAFASNAEDYTSTSYAIDRAPAYVRCVRP